MNDESKARKAIENVTNRIVEHSRKEKEAGMRERPVTRDEARKVAEATAKRYDRNH